MEINEIENMVALCSGDRVLLNRKAQTLVLVNAISSVWDNKGLASKDAARNKDYSNIVGTLEDKLACLAKTIFGVANKLGMDMHSLDLNRHESYQNLEDILLSMDAIAMSNYRMEKKIIILTGKLVSFCLYMGIDIIWFLKNRLVYEIGLK